MASKRIDELTTRVVVNTDLLPPTPTGGPSGSATVAEVVKAGLSQPNSGSAGAGADITIKAADGVTSGAGGNILIKPGAPIVTGLGGRVRFFDPYYPNTVSFDVATDSGVFAIYPTNQNASLLFSSFKTSSFGNFINLFGHGGGGGGSIAIAPTTTNISTNQNNLSLTTSGIQRLNCTSPCDITGITENGSTPTRGRFISVINVGTANLTLKNNDANSSAANRIYSSTNADIVLAPNQWAEFIYDQTNNGSGAAGWRATNSSVGSSAVSYISNTATVAANQNDYVLTGSAFQRINCTSASDITGIAPPTGGSHVDGRMIKVFNVGTANLTFKHNSTSSSAANRLYAASGADIVLGTNDYIECVYDSTDNGSGAAGWRIA